MQPENLCFCAGMRNQHDDDVHFAPVKSFTSRQCDPRPRLKNLACPLNPIAVPECTFAVCIEAQLLRHASLCKGVHGRVMDGVYSRQGVACADLSSETTSIRGGLAVSCMASSGTQIASTLHCFTQHQQSQPPSSALQKPSYTHSSLAPAPRR